MNTTPPAPIAPVKEVYDGESVEKERQEETKLETTLSLTSSVSRETTESNKPLPTRGSQKWYGKLNPLRWRKIPAIPKERRASPEYGANIFSKLSFQWMAPIMHVSYLPTTLFLPDSLNPSRLPKLILENPSHEIP